MFLGIYMIFLYPFSVNASYATELLAIVSKLKSCFRQGKYRLATYLPTILYFIILGCSFLLFTQAAGWEMYWIFFHDKSSSSLLLHCSSIAVKSFIFLQILCHNEHRNVKHHKAHHKLKMYQKKS